MCEGVPEQVKEQTICTRLCEETVTTEHMLSLCTNYTLTRIVSNPSHCHI